MKGNKVLKRILLQLDPYELTGLDREFAQFVESYLEGRNRTGHQETREKSQEASQDLAK